MTILLCAAIGALSGFLLVPIYRRAFTTGGVAQVLWAFPMIGIFGVSLAVAINVSVASVTYPFDLLAWIGAGLAACWLGWQMTAPA